MLVIGEKSSWQSFSISKYLMPMSIAIFYPVWRAHVSARRGKPDPMNFVKPMTQSALSFLIIPPAAITLSFDDPSTFNLYQFKDGFIHARLLGWGNMEEEVWDVWVWAEFQYSVEWYEWFIFEDFLVSCYPDSSKRVNI